MPDAQGLPETKEEMRVYLQTALPLEDSCLIAIVEPKNKIAQQQFPRQEDVLAQAAKVLSLIWVDIQEKPELADLARVHQLEGSGEALFTWFYLQEQKGNSIFLLDIQLQKPVRASFHVPFRIEEWLLLLETIAQQGEIWFVPGPAPDWRPMLKEMGHEAFMKTIEETCGSGITLTLDQDTTRELSEHVQAWKARFPMLT